jgi:phosphate transport system ATP-binding protein
MYEVKLAAKSLNLYFGSKKVLKNINIGFTANKVTALIGPSGCGKSSLLRCFNRMHDLTYDAKIEGHITIDGVDIYDPKVSVTEIRRRIGMVFQKPNPLPKSIYDNLAYGLSIHNTPRHEIHELVEQALKESYLWEEVKMSLKDLQ